jgi:hypothetical protein
MTIQTQALERRFTEDGAHSTFGFSVVVVFNGGNTFRGSLGRPLPRPHREGGVDLDP